jgi:hypothetical protein
MDGVISADDSMVTLLGTERTFLRNLTAIKALTSFELSKRWITGSDVVFGVGTWEVTFLSWDTGSKVFRVGTLELENGVPEMIYPS